MPQPSPLRPTDPVRAGAFVLSARLGRGGQGAVYLGERADGVRAAVKILHTDWHDAAELKRLLGNELTKARRVAPFVTAQVLDFDLDGDPPFIASEFIDGPTLTEAVTENGPLRDSRLHQFAMQTIVALEAIHAVGLVHRDFKPGNVMLGPGGAQVIDFGIALTADATHTQDGMVKGSYRFMAPEQIRGKQVTAAADVFAWASTMVYAATGQHAFAGDHEVAVLHSITQSEPDLHGLDGPLGDLVRRCLSKDPQDRPSTERVRRHLLGAADSHTLSMPPLRERGGAAEPRLFVQSEPVTPPSPSQRSSRWRRLIRSGRSSPGGSAGSTGGRPVTPFTPGQSQVPTPPPAAMSPPAMPSSGMPSSGMPPFATSGPSMPSASSVPGMPNMPNMPHSVPGMPGSAQLPRLPTASGMPRLPTTSGVPGMPRLPTTSGVPGMPLPGSGGLRLPGGSSPFQGQLMPPRPPRSGRILTVGVSLMSIAAIAVTGWFWWTDRQQAGQTTQQQQAQGSGQTDDGLGISQELREFAAGWPIQGCRRAANPPAGLAERLDCRLPGNPPIDVYFIRYEPGASLRDERRARVERVRANRPRGYRIGTGVGPGGRRGPYVEYRVAPGVSGLWWDDSISRPDGGTALNMHVRVSQSAKEPARRLRDAWRDEGWSFEPG